LSIKVKNNKSKRAEEEFSRKVGLFDKLPSECLTCLQPFDKEDREMVTSWFVVVKEEKNQVNLYCPTCWQKAIEFLEENNEIFDS
tara:strand:- start:374 stop:628 length:255 start_codon:yes stop_codon:yes gene_type:complete